MNISYSRPVRVKILETNSVNGLFPGQVAVLIFELNESGNPMHFYLAAEDSTTAFYKSGRIFGRVHCNAFDTNILRMRAGASTHSIEVLGDIAAIGFEPMVVAPFGSDW